MSSRAATTTGKSRDTEVEKSLASDFGRLSMMSSEDAALLALCNKQQAFVDEISRISAKDSNVPIIDLREEMFNTESSILFPCTATLRGRLSPFPHIPTAYLLDFITEDGKRVSKAANLGVYDLGSFGDERQVEMQPFGSLPPKRAEVDLYLLSTKRVCQIQLRDNGAPLKTIRLLYMPPSGLIVPHLA